MATKASVPAVREHLNTKPKKNAKTSIVHLYYCLTTFWGKNKP